MKSLSSQLRDSGVQVLTLDIHNEKMNVLRRDLIEEFTLVFTEAEANEDVRGIVLVSGKPDSFIAGADIDMIASVETSEDAAELARQLQDMTLLIQNLKKPTAVAIHGVCLGGGLEIAMAFDYRIASTDRKTKLGLPEVQLGLLPGGSGTQRLPRLVDLPIALDMVLTGKNLSAKSALKAGLVSDIAAQSIIIDIAEKWVLKGKLKPRKQSLKDRVMKSSIGLDLIFKQARKQTLAKTSGNYPAPMKIIDVMEVGLTQGFDKGLEAERKGFGQLAMSVESTQLRGIYFATTELKKELGVKGDAQEIIRPVDKVGVLGAGLMGAGIAYVSMKNAGAKVRLKDRDIEGVGRGIEYINKLLRKQVNRRRMTPLQKQQLQSKISATADYSGFQSADIVIEAVFEDLDLKKRMIADIESIEGEGDIIFASNTSALPIDDIAEDAKKPENVIGMHYFSPVEKMPLLEIIVSKKTADWVIASCVEFGKRQGKTVIVVNDGPGFYTTRILVPYINEAIRMIAEGVAIERIDGVLEKVGFPVGPIVLLDEVGIDVASHIADVMHQSFGERLAPLKAMKNVINDGRKGKKNKKGFYDYNVSKKGFIELLKSKFIKNAKKPVDGSIYALLDVKRGVTRVATSSDTLDLLDEEISNRCLLQMVNEAAYCLEEGILQSPRDGDIGAIFGLGFPPFLGGPFRYADVLGIDTLVSKLKSLEEKYGLRFKPAPILEKLAKSGKTFY